MKSLNICASGQKDIEGVVVGSTTKILPNNYTNLSQNFFTSVDSDKNSKDDTKEEETEEKVKRNISLEKSIWHNMLSGVLRATLQTNLTTSAKRHW